MIKMFKLVKTPRVRAYAHHAYVTAMIESAIAEDETENLLSLEILNSTDYAWINPSNIPNKNNQFWITEKENDMYRYVFRECDDSDEIIVRIDNLQNKVEDSILNFVITGENFKECIIQKKNLYCSGYLYNRILTRYANTFVVDKFINQRNYRFFKLCKNMNLSIPEKRGIPKTYIYPSASFPNTKETTAFLQRMLS